MIKRHLTEILLIAVAGLLVSDILIRLWFCNDLHLLWSPENFNNVVTPTGTIISTLLFFIALRLTMKQNRIIQSQNEKSNFDHEVNDLKRNLEKDISDSIMMTIGINSKSEILTGINSINYLDKIQESIDRLFNSEQYGKDLKYFENNEKMRISELMTRDYFRDVKFILTFSQFPVVKYYHVTNLIDDINSSEMLDVDKAFVKRKVRVFVERYMSFVLYSAETAVPDIFDNVDNCVTWKKYKDTGFDRYYKTFVTELK